VLVNKAGYGQFGSAEEVSEQEIRDQLETNLLRPLAAAADGAAAVARAPFR
jgi:NAD(P)-dependent dehydrogenase (short-subunit alcohol dehydrogenase family)